MTYWNLQLGGLGGSIFNYATATEARDLTRRIAAAAPGLAERIAAREPDGAFRTRSFCRTRAGSEG
jgi:hypothetical protein